MKKIIILLTMVVALVSCTTDADDEWDAAKVCPESKRGTFVDERDGQAYKYTTIGEQVWMAENLRYKSEGSICFFDDNVCDSTGRYYLFDNALCPAGWHLPTSDEWLVLVDNVGGADKAAIHLKSESGWRPLNPGDNGNGLDDCAFDMMPSNRGDKNDGFISDFLTSTRDSSVSNFIGVVGAASYLDLIEIGSRGLNIFSSVRCIRD